MLEMLQLDFMQNALIAGILVSIACGVMGSLVEKFRSVRTFANLGKFDH